MNSNVFDRMCHLGSAAAILQNINGHIIHGRILQSCKMSYCAFNNNENQGKAHLKLKLLASDIPRTFTPYNL